MIVTLVVKLNLSKWGTKSKGDHFQEFIVRLEYCSPDFSPLDRTKSVDEAIKYAIDMWDHPLIVVAFVTPAPPEVVRGVLFTIDSLTEWVKHVNPEIPADESIPVRMPRVCKSDVH